ncbi:NADAR family protein [Pedobacter polaris]|uniref:NADAR family protein n=1 Tax=Pedobacter polaris TaxID=2571273 RepID=A0A4U1CWX7_9SPHI|nr:NADAR family protein [Pedobacter polaris]TKC12800.1 NADAR family protein [Pedobacter polaris]
MKYIIKDTDLRVYKLSESCIFKKNNERHGQLSNMASGFPIKVNNVSIKTTEALYQACRFPHRPDIQAKLINEISPMHVKMLSNSHKIDSRPDWEDVRIKVMKWCVNLKLAQNILSFGEVLNSTGSKYLVENSSKDNFWGAIPDSNNEHYTGQNALGRLLMDLRQKFQGSQWLDLLYVEPPEISNFLLYNDEIKIIDERLNYIKSLVKYWKIEHKIILKHFDEADNKFYNLGLKINGQKGLF